MSDEKLSEQLAEFSSMLSVGTISKTDTRTWIEAVRAVEERLQAAEAERDALRSELAAVKIWADAELGRALERHLASIKAVRLETLREVSGMGGMRSSCPTGVSGIDIQALIDDAKKSL